MALILIVEDELAQRVLYGELIDVMGHEHIVASNAVAGLRLAKSSLPDIIVTDINMPEMNGEEFLRALKADPETNDIPVIALTGLTRDRQHFIDMGFVDYLMKPVTLPYMARIINIHL